MTFNKRPTSNIHSECSYLSYQAQDAFRSLKSNNTIFMNSEGTFLGLIWVFTQDVALNTTPARGRDKDTT